MVTLWNVAAYSLQLAALVTVGFSTLWLLRVRAARHALRFWQVVLAIAILLPLAQPRSTDPISIPFLTQSGSVEAASLPPAAAPSVEIATLVLILIVAGIFARLSWLAIGLMRVRSIAAGATRDESLAPLVHEIGTAIGVGAEVRITDRLEGPATVGFRQPIVLLPRSVLAMSPAVQRAILCHELLHVRRRDWLQTIAEECWRSLLWFHPHARLVASRLSLSREMVVDEATILITRDRRAYAEALLAFSNPQPHVIGVTPFIGRRTLSQRIALIAQEDSMPHRRAMSYLSISLVVMIAITAAAVARFPMFATLEAQSVVYAPGDGISLPGVVTEVKPKYTPEAMQRKIQGSVWLLCVVGESGDITDVQVSRSLDPEFGLDQAAIDAARQWKFTPGRKDGKPVAVRVTIELTFTLKK